MKTLATALAATVLIGTASAASAQGFPATPYDGAMNQLMRQQAQLNAQLAGAENQVANGAMGDPRVQAGYQQYRMRGGTQDFRTWAINYRWTNGYTAAGMRYVYGVQAQNAANERAAWQRYQMAQAERAQAMQMQRDGYARNQYQAGLQLNGYRYVNTPNGTLWYKVY